MMKNSHILNVMKSSIKINGLTNVIKSFEKDIIKNEIGVKNTIDKYSILLQSNMRMLLRERVIKWTGRLAYSIQIYSISPHMKLIEPNTPYQYWIEVGGRGGFEGYHYVEESSEKYEEKIIEELKKY